MLVLFSLQGLCDVEARCVTVGVGSECVNTTVCPAEYNCDPSGFCGTFNASFKFGCIATPVDPTGVHQKGTICGPDDPTFSASSFPLGCCCFQLSCPPGKYGSPLWSECKDCEAGKFSSQTTKNMASGCTWCPAGSYSGAGATECLKCSEGKYAKPAFIQETRYPDKGLVLSTYFGGTNCTECKVCRNPTAVPLYPCRPGSADDTVTAGGCTCPEGYFVKNRLDPQNFTCSVCKSCSDPAAVLQNPCHAGDTKDSTTGCSCPVGFKALNATPTDPYAVKCSPVSDSGPVSGDSGPVTIINNYVTVVVLIFQFQAPYQLSEMTDDVVNKMTRAVAEVLNVNSSNVVLSFVAMRRRVLLQQSGGVLVSVSLKDYEGPSGGFGSRFVSRASLARRYFFNILAKFCEIDP